VYGAFFDFQSEFMTSMRINLWSGPRNVSTALMYSFAQRDDTRVVDEPLYAHYLRVSGALHPGGAEVLAAQNNDGEQVVRDLILGPCDRPVLFMKQMAHHLVELGHDFLAQTANVLLIRDPAQMLPSLVNQIPQPSLRDTGLATQAALFEELRALGQNPPVLDAKLLLLNPRSVLRQLCDRLRLGFQEQMLHWPAGARAEDGVWARHWYDNVHKSTGFEAYREKREPFPQRLLPVLNDCQPHYEFLERMALRGE
jgi:hypothetical protein